MLAPKNDVESVDDGSAQAEDQIERNEMNYRGGRHNCCTQVHLPYQTGSFAKTIHA